MLSTPTYLAQEAPEGHDSPLRIWLDGWLVYLQDHLTTIFLLVVAVVGLVVLVRGGIKQTIFFIVGAGLVAAAPVQPGQRGGVLPGGATSAGQHLPAARRWPGPDPRQ